MNENHLKCRVCRNSIHGFARGQSSIDENENDDFSLRRIYMWNVNHFQFFIFLFIQFQPSILNCSIWHIRCAKATMYSVLTVPFLSMKSYSVVDRNIFNLWSKEIICYGSRTEDTTSRGVRLDSIEQGSTGSHPRRIQWEILAQSQIEPICSDRCVQCSWANSIRFPENVLIIHL